MSKCLSEKEGKGENQVRVFQKNESRIKEKGNLKFIEQFLLLIMRRGYEENLETFFVVWVV